MACEERQLGSGEGLVELGAEIEPTENLGGTAIDLASACGRRDALRNTLRP